MDATTVVVGATTGLLALVGAFGGSLLSRRGDKEFDRLRRREETMRTLRWAVESATSPENAALSEAGFAVLDELMDAELLQPEDRAMVETVTGVVTGATGGMAYAGHSEQVYSGGETFMKREEGDDV